MPQSDRLILDISQTEDFESYYAIHSDPKTNLFNPAGPMNLQKAKAGFHEMLLHWKEYNFGSWTIKSRDTETIIGFGGLSYRLYGDELKLNLGYRFSAESWGQGYATELAKFSIDYGFNVLQQEKIFAIVRPKHMASIKVLEKCKMKLVGKLDDVTGEAHSLIYLIEK